MRSKERPSPAFNQRRSHVQLCTHIIPNFYKPTKYTVISRKSAATSIPSSVNRDTITRTYLPSPIALRVSTDTSLPNSTTPGASRRTSISSSIAQSISTATSLSSFTTHSKSTASPLSRSIFQRRTIKERIKEEDKTMIIFFEHLSPVVIACTFPVHLSTWEVY